MAKRWHGIPTTYRGIKFRSRLEATWAAYFDLRNDNTTWQYEPVDFPGWIPDFSVQIPHFPGPSLAEVKPIYTIESFFASPDSPKMGKALLANVPLAKNFYALLLLGVSPGHVWLMLNYGCGGRWHKLSPPDEGLQKCWAEASNIAQWKAPR